jgi:acyl-coenzyme A synthetase/AMP-(fatty) acid ligase
VVECAVVAIPDEIHTNKIKAYVSVGPGVDAAALVRTCAEPFRST